MMLQLVNRRFAPTATALALSAGLAAPTFAQDAANLAPADAIKGTMQITYNTRTPSGMEEGSPKAGVKDTYVVDLTVNNTRKFGGNISRQPRITSMGGLRTVQQPQYDYSMKLSVINSKDPSQVKTVGDWVGAMPVEEKTGAFILDSGADTGRQLRISVDVGTPLKDNFGGRLYGKPADKTKLSWTSVKRYVNGKTIEKKFEADPMRFDSLILAEGPDKGRYPRATVTGELNYDRETGNYYPNNLRFRYTFDGKEIEDIVTGTIKWVEDPNRDSNGKGQYEFNLRFNEEKNQKPAGEDAAFAGLSDEDAFFAVDNSIPALTGTVAYQDTFSGDNVTSSQVTYNLKANKLTPQQTMNFAKLWLIAVGPVNDE